MMRSTMNDDDDEFAPNPFRSSESTDFLDAANPAPAVGNSFGQQPLYNQQQQFSQQQQQQFSQPDPNSGMTGSFQLPVPGPPPVQPDPSQYLSGTMDQNAQLRANNNLGQQPRDQPHSIFSWRGIMGCFHMDTAVKLFDVDSADVYERLRGSMIHFHQPDQFRTAVIGDEAAQLAANNGHISPRSAAAAVPIADRKGPDLYGPFWISMTLMFVLGMTSNLSDYMHHKRKADEEFDYDILHLMNALYIVFGYVFGVPTVFWLTSQCIGMPGVPWALWVCVYGYSQSIVVLGALVAWCLPFALYHVVVVAVSVGCSGVLIVRNLSTPLLSQDNASQAKAAPLLLAILGAHFAYFLVLKLSFYT